MDLDRLKSTFKNKYGSDPRVFRAPGRVNLIGEHTDYNDGFVLPAALDFSTYIAAAARGDRLIRAESLDFGAPVEFDLDIIDSSSGQAWAEYVRGVAIILEREGFRLGGADLLIDSDVPVGAGLSSSAALEISTAFALANLSGHEVEPMKLAKIGQAAEHEFAGVRSGIMDQFASVFGRVGQALFLDCRSMEWSAVLVADARFMFCNTNTKHELADGEYNKRRAECEAAAAFFGKPSLRDVGETEFTARSDEMPFVARKRARHVITENQRVLDSVAALSRNDLAEFGSLMNASHESLRIDFEVSSPELDIMVDLARSIEGVLGARMTGGGFGGCAIALLAPNARHDFAENILEQYKTATSIDGEIYDCQIGGGVTEVVG